MIGGRDDRLKTMWADRVVGALSGGVGGSVVGNWGQKIRQGGLILVKENDAPCVESELNGSGNFGSGGVM